MKTAIKNKNSMSNLSNVMPNTEWVTMTFFNLTLKMSVNGEGIILDKNEANRLLSAVANKLRNQGMPITRENVKEKLKMVAINFMVSK